MASKTGEGRSYKPKPAGPKKGRYGPPSTEETHYDSYKELGGGGKVSKGPGKIHHPKPFSK